MTLTEMLVNAGQGGAVHVEYSKQIFKEWLETVGLPQYYNPDGMCFNATESLRKLLIQLVDEP